MDNVCKQKNNLNMRIKKDSLNFNVITTALVYMHKHDQLCTDGVYLLFLL